MRYFEISTGLRGCYTADDAYIGAFRSRRELKRCIENECNSSREAYGFGGSKKAIAATIAHVWREAKATKKPYLPYAIGFGRSRAANDRPFGVFISHSSRSEYLEYIKNSND